MTDFPSARERLERGRVDSGVRIHDLWLDCLGMGFNASLEKLQAIFDDAETPSCNDYDLIAQCLNERLKDLGVSTLVPYCEEIDL